MKNINLLLIALLSLCVGCVTSGDLARIEDAQANYRTDVDRSLADLRSGAITGAEADARIAASERTLKEEIEATVDAAEERTTAVASAASKIPTDPISLLTYIGGLGAAVMGTSSVASRKVNRDRDMARRLRGEQTGVAPPHPA